MLSSLRLLWRCRRQLAHTPLSTQLVRRLGKSSTATDNAELFHSGDAPAVPLEWSRILNPANRDYISADVHRRKGVGDIDQVLKLYQCYRTAPVDQRRAALDELVDEALRLPNRTRPGNDSDDMLPLRTVGQKCNFAFPAKDFRRRAEKLNMFRMDHLGLLTGSRTYYLRGALAQLEAALVRFAIATLIRAGFRLVSVPDMLEPRVLEACGVPVAGQRRMVYSLDEQRHGSVCLSGTAEMALAALLSRRSLPGRSLPLRLAAVSRCFRPEVSNLEIEAGLYRVHQFTKVEMFGACAADESASSQLLEEFVSIQERIFTALGLHFTVFDMPAHELGAAAYRKYDIEAWMPGRQRYGEVSSASDCTDYQSRRLDIRDADGRLLHTVNGTACAVPRALIALVETHQRRDGGFDIPEVLRPYVDGMETVTGGSRPRPKLLSGHRLYLTGEADLAEDR